LAKIILKIVFILLPQPAQFIPLNLFGFYLTGMEFIFLFIPSGLNLLFFV